MPFLFLTICGTSCRWQQIFDLDTTSNLDLQMGPKPCPMTVRHKTTRTLRTQRALTLDLELVAEALAPQKVVEREVFRFWSVVKATCSSFSYIEVFP